MHLTSHRNPICQSQGIFWEALNSYLVAGLLAKECQSGHLRNLGGKRLEEMFDNWPLFFKEVVSFLCFLFFDDIDKSRSAVIDAEC